ncbi:MAG: hypothetical protein ACHQYO_08485 [Halanaerobiales bacterium]|mgnify:FL=1
MDNKVGDVIEVIYDEENPENMVVKKRNHITFMLAFMGIILIIYGLYLNKKF